MFCFPEQILFKGFPGNCDALMSLKAGAMETGSSGRWATEWEDCAKPLITQVKSFSSLSLSLSHIFVDLFLIRCLIHAGRVSNNGLRKEKTRYKFLFTQSYRSQDLSQNIDNSLIPKRYWQEYVYE